MYFHIIVLLIILLLAYGEEAYLGYPPLQSYYFKGTDTTLVVAGFVFLCFEVIYWLAASIETGCVFFSRL